MPADDPLIRFDGQVVLVTGAGRGIGSAHARLFAERGAHVVVNDLDADVAEAVVAEIVAAGQCASAAVGDVVDDARAVVATALVVQDRLDVVVNNAGIACAEPFGDLSAPVVERLVRSHAIGTAAITAAAWTSLVASRGRVVNTTSNAVIGLLHSTAYAAAKGAVLGFTHALALEAEPLGVRVNAVMPMARTRMYELAGGETGSQEDEMLSAHFPPERVAPVVVYLGSSSLPFNGQIVEVSGGTTAFVHFAVTPYMRANTPEEARHVLTTAPADATVVPGLAEMLGDKLAMF